MLTVEIICDRCGRTRSVTLPYRGSRPIMDAVTIGVEVFNDSWFRMQPDGVHTCRWCSLGTEACASAARAWRGLCCVGRALAPVLKFAGLSVLAVCSVLLSIVLLERIDGDEM